MLSCKIDLLGEFVMEVKLYNSLTDQIETFKPIKEKEMTCYVCGPTVYNYVHFGNMRPVVVFDVLRRLFIYLGYKVTFISNFTDIDDKIIAEAKKENLDEKTIADKYIKAFEEDREAIHSLKPTYQPRVVENMDKIIDFIGKMVANGYAYVVDGDVYFRVSKIDDYGSLSNMKKDDLIAGARIEENSKKESPLDFALWKKTDEGIQFDSPWSKGRPGWHSECVVMINSLVAGGHIDIHGGGFDLKFPHHENEIAQSIAVNGHKIANVWMHNGFINIDNVKMSKSLGNVKQAKQMLNLYGGNVVRFILLNTHYRSPINFSDELASNASKELDKISQSFNKLSIELQLNNIELNGNVSEDSMIVFTSALADDLNTPNAITELYRVVKEGNIALRNREKDLVKIKEIYNTLKEMFNLLGLEIVDKKLDQEDIKLFKEYNLSRENKDFEKSDQYRKMLIARGLM